MSLTHKTEFSPNLTQRAFIESRARADLMSSRMGEGKTAGLCWAAFYHTKHNPGATWALIRDTWENMQATTMKEFFKWFPPGVYGTFHATKKTFTWAEGVAKGEVCFLGLDDPADATKLQSRELAGFGMDEPAPAVTSGGIDELVFDIALTRLRAPGMKWYAAKLAENNPDETHWTYRRFVDPGSEGFRVWQPDAPENERNLPPDYYANMRRSLSHRPDLVRRFVEGAFGFQQSGRAVTPQWSDKRHLAVGLAPMPRQELVLLWDFGHNPTCIVTQRTPLGHWLILDAVVGEDMGVEELIAQAVKPLLVDRYAPLKCSWRHTGDPQGKQREQTSIRRSAVALIRAELGGAWRPGPVSIPERLEPLRAVLTRSIGDKGLVQVDRARAAAVWHALRGGWHFPVARTGLVGGQPVKNIHSHPGDAMGYGAAMLFPVGRLQRPAEGTGPQQGAGYFGGGPAAEAPLGFEKPGKQVPQHGAPMRLPG